MSLIHHFGSRRLADTALGLGSGSEAHQTENCFWLSQAVNDLQLWLSLMQGVFITEGRTGSPGLMGINISQAIPALGSRAAAGPAPADHLPPLHKGLQDGSGA